CCSGRMLLLPSAVPCGILEISRGLELTPDSSWTCSLGTAIFVGTSGTGKLSSPLIFSITLSFSAIS
ncbi:MAG: hypothetical protein RR332_02065, partial [Clostridiales bacterium]